MWMLVLYSCLTVDAGAPGLGDAIQFERNAATSRMAPHTIHLKFQVRTALTNADTGELMPIDSRVHSQEEYEWWLSGDNARLDSSQDWVDVQQPDGTLAKPLPGKAPRRLTKRLRTQNLYVDLDSTEYSKPLNLSNTILKPERGRVIPDFRLLGIIPEPVDLLHNFKINDILGAEGRTQSQLSLTEYRGFTAVTSRYELPSGQVRTITFVPEWGNGIVRVELQSSRAGQSRFTLVDSSLKEFANGIWFPERVERRVTRGGKLVNHEIIDIMYANFFHEVAADVFTLEGLTPVDGTVFRDMRVSPPKRVVYRSGKPQALVPQKPPSDGTLRPIVEEGMSTPRFILFWSSLTIACLFFYWAYRRQRSQE